MTAFSIGTVARLSTSAKGRDCLTAEWIRLRLAEDGSTSAPRWALRRCSQPPDFGEDFETEAIIENSRNYHESALAPVRTLVATSGVKARFEVAVGHPAEQIIYHADRYQVDLIVLGHRGKSLFRRLLLGSVSKQVVQYADRTVLVVR